MESLRPPSPVSASPPELDGAGWGAGR